MAIASRHADGDGKWSGSQKIPMRLNTPHAASETINQ
jgi:hypothetical protein